MEHNEENENTAPPPAGGDGGGNRGDEKPRKARRFGRRRPGRGQGQGQDRAERPPRVEGAGEASADTMNAEAVESNPERTPREDRAPRQQRGNGRGRLNRNRNRERNPDGAPSEAGNPETRGDKQRLHKALAQTGIGSRREMEALIADGQVEVNGETAQVGQSVEPGDRVHVKRRKVNVKFGDEKPRVLLYHKPAGEIVSRDDPEGRPTVFDNIKAPDHGKWVAVGRLDFNSEGLLLFTTYGELANRLMHPRYQVIREYSVRVLGELTPEQEDQLIDGIELEDGPARVLSLEIEGGEGANRWYRLTLQEGRNREVRRLFEALGLTVSRLIRIRYGDINMPSWLKRGQSKLMDEAETFALLTSVGLRSNSARAQMKRAMKGAPAPVAQIGVMRNAREHELAREGRLNDDPAQRARGAKSRKGKPRIDALATSFGFDNAGRKPRPRTPGNSMGAGAGGGAPKPRGNNKRRGPGQPAANGNVAPNANGNANRKRPRGKGGRGGGNGNGGGGASTTAQGIDYAGLPADE